MTLEKGQDVCVLPGDGYWRGLDKPDGLAEVVSVIPPEPFEQAFAVLHGPLVMVRSLRPRMRDCVRERTQTAPVRFASLIERGPLSWVVCPECGQAVPGVGVPEFHRYWRGMSDYPPCPGGEEEG